MLNASLDNKFSIANLGLVMQQTMYSALSVELPKAQNTQIAISDIKVREEKESAYKNNVYFRDPLSLAYVSVGLSDENLEKLKNVFGAESFKKNKDGILLKGEAENFVSGWFGDIAYKRGYLKADSNKDGYLNKTEQKNATDRSGGIFENIGNVISVTKIFTYQKPDEYSQLFEKSFIEEELNIALNNDKNADGKIKWEEMESKFEVASRIIQSFLENKTKKPKIPKDKELEELEAMLEQIKQNLKEQLSKQGVKISEKELESMSLETLQNMLSRAEDSKELSASKDSTLLNTQQNTQNSPDSSLFNQLKELTKLDSKTLENNLQNNPNFEDEIISIVKGLTKSVDDFYKNKQDSTLSINA